MKKQKIALIIAFLLISGIFIVNQARSKFYYTRVVSSEGSREKPDSLQIDLEDVDYIKTLAETEIFDTNNNVLGIIGKNQTFAVEGIVNDQLLKLTDLPFYVNYNQIETVKQFQQQEPIDLDLSRYLAFEQMIAKGRAVNFYHLDQTFAFRLNDLDTDINIYMQGSDHFYVNYLDTYFLVNKGDVNLIDNPNALPETTNIPVLMYHFFCNSAEGVDCRDNNWIESDHFEEHMQYLHDNNFTSLKMIDIERFLNGDVRLPKQSVAITIDDAHPTVFEYAYPTLVTWDQIATVFTITHKTLDFETLLLSNNLELHSHTHDMHRGHCDAGSGGLMQCINFDEGVADLKQSSSLLNDSTVFAYPFGDYNDHTIAMLQASHFTLAFTTENGLVTRTSSPLTLPRIRISTDTHLTQFSHLVNP